jgi:hypothetical protein
MIVFSAPTILKEPWSISSYTVPLPAVAGISWVCMSPSSCHVCVSLISSRIGPTTDPESVTRPDRGRTAKPMACGPPSRSAKIKGRGGGRGTRYEVHRVAYSPTKNPSPIRSKGRCSDGKHRRLCTALPPQSHPRPRLRLGFISAMANNGESGSSTGGTPYISLPLSLCFTLG